MSIRVAATSSDGKHINQHFGKAQKFLIIDIEDNGEYQFVELRETPPRCDADDNVKERIIDMLSDCNVLLTTRLDQGLGINWKKKACGP